MAHTTISPAILYWGTPVALIASENEDGSHNLCAISSAFWLGDRCILGFGASGHTIHNIRRTGQCTVNLPDESMTACINALATTTGTPSPSASKLNRGYRFVKDKWSVAALTQQQSISVRPPRVLECPVQMECEFADSHALMKDEPTMAGNLIIVELRVRQVHVHNTLRMAGYANRIDPDKWKPMIMSFQELYGIKSGKLGTSQLAKIDEEKYRMKPLTPMVATTSQEDEGGSKPATDAQIEVLVTA